MPQGAAAAAPHRLRVPAHWRAIDFISDLHLSARMPRTVAAWQRHLQATDADAVFILGDLFELWVGDDSRAQPFESRCVQVMREAAARRPLALMVGNRDFLLGTAMADACGATLLDDPTCVEAFGSSALLTHGDALCLADAEYQAFRRMVRSAQWQQAFLAKPLPERQCIAADIRARSETRKRFDGAMLADVDRDAAQAWLDAAACSTLVHGHTHRPRSESLGASAQRHVLSDWDLDSASRAEVLRWTAGGWHRLAPFA